MLARVVCIVTFFFFFSSRRRHTRCREVSWARRCVQETGIATSESDTISRFTLEQGSLAIQMQMTFRIPAHRRNLGGRLASLSCQSVVIVVCNYNFCGFFTRPAAPRHAPRVS
eukprot:TRINITY_DN14298_c0_g1_i2.p3 TRINITY_DN14298_c0_g1~~TRINITY_DN14298_c0_g1_i2.p3  ORF type:complete len:113 (+),score=7.05 TRINITY_DN14298_c0_g1_i2:50-388(+)